MSKNRDNVSWQSKDGSWNIGFYDYYESSETRDEEYGFDDEWDMEYSDQFHWVSTGHRSQEDAKHSWRDANPGGGSIVAYSEENEADVIALDDKAAQTYLAVNSGQRSGLNQIPSYKGPKKDRDPGIMAKDLYSLKSEAARHLFHGFTNLPDPKLKILEKAMSEVDLGSLTERQKSAVELSRSKYKDGLQDFVKQFENRNRRDVPYDMRTRAIHSQKVDAVNKFRDEIEQLSKPLPLAPKVQVKESSNAVDSNSPRYHISPDSGRPNICRATKQACPYGGKENHYGSKEEARTSYEKKMGSGLGKLKK